MKGAQDKVCLWNAPLGRIEVIDSGLADGAHLVYVYSIRCYELNVLEASVRTEELYTMHYSWTSAI